MAGVRVQIPSQSAKPARQNRIPVSEISVLVSSIKGPYWQQMVMIVESWSIHSFHAERSGDAAKVLSYIVQHGRYADQENLWTYDNLEGLLRHPPVHACMHTYIHAYKILYDMSCHDYEYQALCTKLKTPGGIMNVQPKMPTFQGLQDWDVKAYFRTNVCFVLRV